MSVDLFQLLPAVYRIRDAEIAAASPLLTAAEHADLTALQAKGGLSVDEQRQLDELTAKAARGPLQSLLMVIGEQLAAVAYDLDRLYDDQFIETCAPWVVPYLGDLIGYQPIRGGAGGQDISRAEVAQTISFRRRKGTILVIEQLARDLTEWGAHAVEFFQILGDTQYMKHIRPWNHYAPDFRDWRTGIYIERAFDRASHRVDVRRIVSRRGRYNIRNIGVVLWSLGAYGIEGASPADAPPPAAGNAKCYRFSALGMDMPLFHRAVSQGEEITAPAGPVNVPDRLRRRVLCDDLQKGVGAQYYGINASLLIAPGGKPLDPYEILVANLSGPDGSWANLPLTAPYRAAIDPELGRLAVDPAALVDKSGKPLKLTVSYFYGFNAPIGGGDYPRVERFFVQDPAFVLRLPDTAQPPRYTDLQGALTQAQAEFALKGAIAVEIDDDDTHVAPSVLEIDLPAGTTFELRAAEGRRPTLLLNETLTVGGDAASVFILNGFVLAANAGFNVSAPALVQAPQLRPSTSVEVNQLSQLQLTDCTLVPGWSVDARGAPQHADSPAVRIDAPSVELVIQRSIVGALRVAEFATTKASDSIIDATERTRVAYADVNHASGGGALTLNGCTVIGKAHAHELTLVSDSIFWSALAPKDTWSASLIADRRQAGCVRFSFLPVGAITPRRFKCVQQALASPHPLFFSHRYGDPAYLKMLTSTDDTIRRGAEDGGEMGAYHFLGSPQRENNLRIRLQEYVPVGLEFGFIYET